MGYKARWGPMGFTISPSKIVPFDNLRTTIAIKTDNGNDTSGASATNNRGLANQSIQFSTQYIRAVGVDPRKSFDDWAALVGSTYPLYVGEKRFGPSKMTLKSVAISDSVLNTEGVFLSITLNIVLEEITATVKTSKKKSVKSNTTIDNSAAKKAAEAYEQYIQKRKAMQATASTTERRGKLYTDRRLR